MNQQAFQAAKAAYQSGDMGQAVSAMRSCLEPGEVNGEANHLLGNALMKLGLYAEAAQAYDSALKDVSYGKVGALSCNLGRARLAAGDTQGAIASLQAAVADQSYATPYKAYLALGNACMKAGDLREAGVAFRNAAIDENNPDPASSLTKLGGCFIELGRPLDAVEAYRTALDFSTPIESQSSIYSDLGSAYVAANRMTEAVDAFSHAVADGTYKLSPSAQAAYEAAQKAVAAIAHGPSSTDAMLAAAGYGGTGAYDPLDPMGKSGEVMPSPEDTGFFSVSEQDLVQQEKDDRKKHRKHRHVGLKILIVLIVLVLLLAAAAGFAFYKGYGWPTQQTVVEELFKSKTDNGDVGAYLAGSVSSDSRKQIEAIVPSGASVAVDGVDQDMTSSTLLVTASLAQGGTQDYVVTMTRDGIGWKVTGVTLDYASQSGSSATVSGATTSSSTSSASTTSATMTL